MNTLQNMGENTSINILFIIYNICIRIFGDDDASDTSDAIDNHISDGINSDSSYVGDTIITIHDIRDGDDIDSSFIDSSFTDDIEGTSDDDYDNACITENISIMSNYDNAQTTKYNNDFYDYYLDFCNNCQITIDTHSYYCEKCKI